VSVAVGTSTPPSAGSSPFCSEFPRRGNRTIASATLRCTAEDNGRIASNTVRVGVHYTPDVAEVARHRDWEVEAKSEVAASTRRVEEALAELDRGDKDAALARLNEARQGLAASPAVAAGGAAADAIREQEAGYKHTPTRSPVRRDGQQSEEVDPVRKLSDTEEAIEGASVSGQGRGVRHEGKTLAGALVL